MLAYIKLVQQKERELGVDILTHQKWFASSFIHPSAVGGQETELHPCVLFSGAERTMWTASSRL